MSDPSLTNDVGFAAASLVLASFCMRSMKPLRWVALASNVVFIAYGYLGGLAPVLLLHALLLPVNVYRLTQLRSARVRDKSASARRPTSRLFAALQGGALSHRGGRPNQTGGSHA